MPICLFVVARFGRLFDAWSAERALTALVDLQRLRRLFPFFFVAVDFFVQLETASRITLAAREASRWRPIRYDCMTRPCGLRERALRNADACASAVRGPQMQMRSGGRERRLRVRRGRTRSRFTGWLRAVSALRERDAIFCESSFPHLASAFHWLRT